MLSTLAILAALQPEPAVQPAPPAAPTLAPTVLWSRPLGSTSFGGGAAADVNGDGKADVAFASYFGDSMVRVLDGPSGAELWTFDASSAKGKGDACLDASCRFFDLDADGRLELIVPVSNRSQVLCFDAAKGSLRWTYEAGQGECIDTPPLIQDLDGDGKVEIVVGTFGGNLHLINADGTRLKILRIAKGAVQSCPVFAPLGEGKRPGLIAALFNGDNAFHAMDAETGDELFKVQTKGTIYHGVATADLDADGRGDFVGCSYDGRLYAFDALGKPLWTARPGDAYFMSPASIADLDGDGKPEVIAASEKATALHADGSVLYSIPAKPKAQAWGVTRGVSIADLDGDGAPDLAFTDGCATLTLLRGKDGALLGRFESDTLLPKTPQTCSSAPIIADFNGDGVLDLFYVAGHGDTSKGSCGAAVCLTGLKGKGPGWPTHRHDEKNTGAWAR